ncbi:tyrosine-type recombinase/integrase [Aeropyrum pernix]|uniref:tyrosine-type recombinase/integrase n=1 Tax=Aeropyrum pernix TaxID=56636 RepID=UPI000005DCD2|nr:tyrosine-type recombinase/integrase [Aeropyrum pernix]
MEAYSKNSTAAPSSSHAEGESTADVLGYEGVEVLPEPKDVPQEARRQLLNLLAERGKVKPSTLGVSRAYFYQMRRGLRPISDSILERLLELATDDDLAGIPFFAPYVDYQRVKGYDVDRLVRLVAEWARANPASAKVFLDSLSAELERLGLVGKAIKVSERHVREFEGYLEARVRSGDMDPGTAGDRLRYLRMALEELGYVLTKQALRGLIRRYQASQPGVADHIYKSLKLFVKEVVQDRELLEAIPYPRVRWGSPEAPQWSDICRVVEALPHAGAPRALLLLLASTGLRVETAYSLPLDSLKLSERLVWVWSLKRSKRTYFSFITERVKGELEVYLEARRRHLEILGRGSGKLFPYKPRRLREAIYEAMDRELGRRFQLKLIRKRVAEHLSHHLSTLELNVIMGHAPREVVEKHYLLRDQIEDLRRKYDKAMAKVPCLGGGEAG